MVLFFAAPFEPGVPNGMSSGKLPYGLVKLGFLLVVTLSQTHWVQASPSEFVAEDYAQVVQRYINEPGKSV